MMNNLSNQTLSRKRSSSSGFSLIELLISLTVFLIISAMVTSFMFSMTMTQGTVANRSEMHSSVRSATEILQQEISQAGRLTFPGTTFPTLSANIVANPLAEQVVGVSDTTMMFGVNDPRILLVVGWGDQEETVAARITNSAAPGAISAIFRKNHSSGDTVRPAGSFINGILSYDNTLHGNTLMMFGDIHDTGNMVFVRYDCMPTAAGDGKLYRREMPWNTAANVADINTNYPPEVLLSNLALNPNSEPCFTYQAKETNWPSLDNASIIKLATFANNNPAVLNIAVTMTSRTEFPDPQTHDYQFQTKALLTVSPRNVFQAFNMANNLSGSQHVQETPAPVAALAALNLTPP